MDILKKKEVKWWKLGDVKLNLLEAAIFNAMLNVCAIGSKSIEELKDMGTLRANKRGGLIVDFDVSKEKRCSLLFGEKFGNYVYRAASFSKIETVLR